MESETDPIIGALEDGGRILITRLQYLGDVILTLPVIDAIRARFPTAEIDYLCRPPASDLLRGDARFSRVFDLQLDGKPGASFRLARRLRERRYAAVVDLYSNPRSAWLTRLTGSPMRIGADLRGRRLLYTHTVSVPIQVRSATSHHMKFVEPLIGSVEPGKPVLAPSEREIESARDLLGQLGIETRRPDGPRIGIHPGGKWEVKRWPAGAFAEMTGILKRDWNADVVAFSGPGDSAHTNKLREAAGDTVVILPELPVRSVAAVLSLLDGMVVSDGGVMHLSVAVGTPTVGIFGSAEPDIWFPYESFGPYAVAAIELECRPCHRHRCPLGHTDCLNRLTPEIVLGKLRDVLGRPAEWQGVNGSTDAVKENE